MKKLMILLFALALLTTVFADVITIGTGTSNTYEPIASYFGYHRSAAIYTAGQIGGSGSITTIAYKAYNTTATVIPIKVYMKMTTAASLAPAASWPTLITGLTALYDGSFSVTTAGAWKTITLTTPFNYTGNNLEIMIESNYGGGGTPGPQWYYSTAANQNQYIRADDTAPTTATGTVNSSLPNVQLDISGYTVFAPTFAVTPTSVAFGIASINTTTAYTNITVSNNGAGTLNVTSAVLGGTDAARFLLDMNSNPLPWALAAGASKIVKVAFNPIAGTAYSAYLRFGGDVRVDHDVALTGTGVDHTITTFPYPQNFDGTWTGTPAAPLGWTVINANVDSYAWIQANTYITPTHSEPYSAHGMGNTNDYLITPPIALTANTRMKWWDKVESATYINTYKVLVSTTDAAIASFTNDLGTFNCANTAWTEHTLNLDAYTGGTIYIAFYQTASASAYYGFGIDDFLLEAIPASPIFVLTPNVTSWDFGQNMINSAATKQFTITNSGGGTINLTSVVATGTYYSISVAPSDVALAAGESTSFTVQYLPTAAGASHTGTLTITDGRAVTTVTLTGSALDLSITPNWAESFDGTTFPPNVAWKNVKTAGTGTPGLWDRQTAGTSPTSTPHSGAGMIRFNNFNLSSGTKGELSTPPITFASDDYRVSFWMYRDAGYASNADLVNVYYSATGQTSVGATLLGTVNRAMGLAPIVATAGWYNYTFNMPSGATGSGRYLIFEAVSAYGNNVFLDDIAIEPLPMGPPNPVTLSAPADGAINQVRLPVLSWTPGTGGTPTSYDIYMDATASPVGPGANPTTLLMNVAASPYTLTTPLSYSTTYIWKVVAKNTSGSSADSAVYSFTTMADPTLPLPYLEDFNASASLPANWTGTFSVGTIGGATGNGLYKNLYSSYTPSVNAITPPVGPLTANTSLEFDYRYTEYDSHPATGYALAAGDKLEIQVSTDGGVTYETIHTINSTNHVTTNQFTTTSIFLTQSKEASEGDIVKVRFLGTWIGGDYYLSIDNVRVKNVSSDPVFAVSPTVKDFGTVEIGSTLNQTFTISNQGGGTMNILGVSLTGATTQFSLTDTNDYPIAVGAPITVSVAFTPIAAGDFTATLTITDDIVSGKGSHTVIITGKGFDATIRDLPYIQTWEVSDLVAGWAVYDSNGDDNTWGLVNDTAGSTAAYMYYNGTLAMNDWLISPAVVLQAGTTYTVSYKYRCESSTYPENMKVAFGNAQNPTAMTTVIADHFEFDNEAYVSNSATFTPSTSGSYYLGIQGYSAADTYALYIDDIRILLPNTEIAQVTATGSTASVTVPAITVGAAQISPVVAFANLSGNPVIHVASSYGVTTNPLTSERMLLTINGGNLAGVQLTFTHNLGFIPQTLAYQIGEGSSIMVPNPGTWTATTASFTLPNLKGPLTVRAIFPKGEDDTLPVELSSFTATLTADMFVQIAWMVQSETSHLGYYILRNTEHEISTAIALTPELISDGTAIGSQISYSYIDTEVDMNTTYYYWLQSFDQGGTVEFFGPLTVLVNGNPDDPGIPAIPVVTQLMDAYPNPFNPSTTIRYGIKDAGNVRIDIFNVRGQKLRSYNNPNAAPGYYSIVWDGKDASGTTVGSGLYLYRMSSGKFVSTKKMLLSK